MDSVKQSMGSQSHVECHKDYMNETWWKFLPLYIFIALAIIALIVMLFSGATAAAFIGYIIFAILWGLLLWWLCDICELGWAWFVLLLPLIIAILTAVVAAGVTGGIVAARNIPTSSASRGF